MVNNLPSIGFVNLINKLYPYLTALFAKLLIDDILIYETRRDETVEKRGKKERNFLSYFILSFYLRLLLACYCYCVPPDICPRISPSGFCCV